MASIPWAIVVLALLCAAARERALHASERATLLQRIQAPDVAIGQHIESDPGPDEEPDDDDPAFINIP